MNVAQLIHQVFTPEAPAPECTAAGACVVCGGHGTGYAMADLVSDGFTAWRYLRHGDCCCEQCSVLFRDRRLRGSSWVVSGTELRFIERADVLPALFDPPAPPFFIYVRKSGASGGRKHGVLASMNLVAGNCDRYAFGHEGYDCPIWFQRAHAEKYRGQVEAVRAVGIAKRDLTGETSYVAWKRAHAAGEMELLRSIQQNKHDPLWEIIVDVYPTE